MSEPLAYLNGEFLPASEARLPVYDAGVVLGATVTEMIRTFHQRPDRLEDHLDRFARSLRYVRFDVGTSTEEFADIAETLVRENARLLRPEEELGLVLFATAGPYPTYAGSAGGTPETRPTLCAHTFPLPFRLWAGKIRHGAHLVTPSTRHVPPHCLPPQIKHRSRMHYYLADREARLVDPDAAALLLDVDGNVTETAGANFFIVEQGAVVSPPGRNILPGISRLTVIELAEELGIPFRERDFQLFHVVNADEAFTASTPYCLMPVTRINGLPVADGRPGPVTHRLLQAWNQRVGLDIHHQITRSASQ